MSRRPRTLRRGGTARPAGGKSEARKLFARRTSPASLGRRCRAPGNERVEVPATNSDGVDDADVGQLALFTQPIDGRRAAPQPFGYISHAQQLIAPAMKRDQVCS